MKRDKKIVLVAHCLLNTNAKVEGLSSVSGAAPIIKKLIDKGYGIIQLPCIEMSMFGTQRWGVVFEQCDFPEYRRRCREHLQPIVWQIEDYLNNGYIIKCVLGIDGSPTCAVNRTVSGKWGGELSGANSFRKNIDTIQKINRKGVMMEELEKILIDKQIDIPFIALDEDHMEDTDILSKL